MKSHRGGILWLVPVLALVTLGVFLSSGPAHAQAFWFETYQKATRLIEAGEPDRAIVLLRLVIEDQPAPISPLRVPGNRFIDYLPYYQRARIQLQQGELEAASHSLDVAEAFGAVMRNRRNWRKFVALREEIGQAVGKRAGLALRHAIAD